ncbi:MAG: DNA topoisomerase III [Pseudomonadota bacterium]
MKLFIAEKPSLGRAIADALPKPLKKAEGFITAGNGDVVSWCIGHLLEQAEPHQYDEAYKRWNHADLPIIPGQWQLNTKTSTRKQFTVLRKLIKQADQLVHAGDPDREGQLLVDEVIEYAGVSSAKKLAAQRLLISDMNPAAVKRALSQLRSNRDFVPLATSALARSRADWLYGINMTRSFTLAGKKAGFKGVLSVGRVQTPVLGLVVKRDREIENFVAIPFYEVWANVQCEDQSEFLAKWKPGEAYQNYQDEEGRITDKAQAKKVADKVNGKRGVVDNFEHKKRSQAAPLPYNLSALQIDAAIRFGLSAKTVLDACQDLYEKHKLITYPRSDCRYLPQEQANMAQSVVTAISESCSTLNEAGSQANLSLNSRAWNDKKVIAHHAIIPTAKALDTSRLARAQAQLYELIARQYLAQFYPPHCFNEIKVSLRIEGEQFVASDRKTVSAGWKALFPVKRHAETANDRKQSIPTLKKGAPVDCTSVELKDKLTQAPLPFSDASLLAAMTGISRFVKDPDVRKILRDTDGLGTEATRAGIIELLFKRDFLVRSGKSISSTPAGRALIDCLPESASLPDMTAQWENHLELISARAANYQSFMQPLVQTLTELVQLGESANAEAFKGLPSAKPRYKRKKPSASGTRSGKKQYPGKRHKTARRS